MSTVYCGSKRSYFEDIPSPPSTKRMRCGSPSNLPSLSSLVDHLSGVFPHLALPVIVRAVEEYGSDVDAAKRSLCALSSIEKKIDRELAAEDAHIAGGTFVSAADNPSGDLVELLLREIGQATCIDDTKARITRVLKKFQEENLTLIKNNTVLKRGFAIQHERLDDANRKVEFLSQLIPQYQEKLRSVEVQNYALKMSMQQAEHGNSMPERFNPDVF